MNIQFNEFELQQSGVRKILEFFDDRLKILRLQNDSYRSDRSTRGRIAEIKDFNKAIEPAKEANSNMMNNAMNS